MISGNSRLKALSVPVTSPPPGEEDADEEPLGPVADGMPQQAKKKEPAALRCMARKGISQNLSRIRVWPLTTAATDSAAARIHTGAWRVAASMTDCMGSAPTLTGPEERSSGSDTAAPRMALAPDQGR